VLWSDPAPDVTGLVPNDNRGIGTMFGPDAVKEFMLTNEIALVLRSHEGPDAREDRPDLPSVQDGFCVDHDVVRGAVVRVQGVEFRDQGTRHRIWSSGFEV
jgi:serine/threonine-protein phosphatase 5